MGVFSRKLTDTDMNTDTLKETPVKVYPIINTLVSWLDDKLCFKKDLNELLEVLKCNGGLFMPLGSSLGL